MEVISSSIPFVRDPKEFASKRTNPGVTGARLYNKVAYSRCAPMYGKCRLLSIESNQPYFTTLP